MKPPIPTPEPIPVQTLRRYGLHATADEVAEVYRQHGELVKLAKSAEEFARFSITDGEVSQLDLQTLYEQAKDILTTATQKKG